MEADRGITNFSKESVVEMQARSFIGAFSVCHFFNSFLIYASNEENTLLAEVFDECRNSFRIYSKTGYKKTAVKCSMFYNSLFQCVFDFWIELSKKNCSKIAEEGQ